MNTRNFATVGSLQQLEYLKRKDRKAFGHYHLIEAPQVLSDRSSRAKARWKALLKPSISFPGLRYKRTIILDTGLMQDNVIPIREIPQIAEIVGATHIILHDVYKDADETIRQSQIALWSYNGLESMRNMRFMFVVQGTDVKSATKCAINFLNSVSTHNLGKIDLALPYHYGHEMRRDIVGSLYARVFANLPRFEGNIHLLGFSELPLSDLNTVNFFGRVMGIDSSQPFLQGAEFCATWRTKEYKRASRPEGYLDTKEPVAQGTELAFETGCHAIRDVTRTLRNV